MTEKYRDPHQLHEWSRHFDSLLWTMSGIFLAAIGVLAVYSLDHFNLWVCLGGLILTGTTAYMIASFRALRRRIHEHMDPVSVQFLRGPRGLKQWPAVLVILGLFVVLWISLLIDKVPSMAWLWIGLGVLCLGLSYYWLWRADHPVQESDA